jgi:hypothetical protein
VILGLAAIADAIKNMRAILSVNLLKNGIAVEQAQALVNILKEHPTLKSLCGNKGNETELDMSGKMTGAGDAIMLAAEIIDNGGLLSLDLTDNMLGERDMANIICVLKEHAIQHHRACACLVGYEFMTKDLRALLVATYNLDPRCWLLAIRIEQLCKDIASWL